VNAKDLHYSMVIQWEPTDGIYVVTVPELPGCVTHGGTYEEAVQQGLDAIDTWVMGEDPATLPPPNTYQIDANASDNTASSRQQPA
jgi:predicted RNase H-like HicB family nuclease